MAEFIITRLWIYPVKSLGGVAVTQVDITPEGSLAGDREWLVVDLDGKMLWQGDIPQMTLLSVGLVDGTLTISTRAGESVSVQTDHGGAAVGVTQYGNDFAGIDAGDDVAAWLSHQLGAQCRLVRIGGLAHRWPKFNPLHVISERSMVILNEEMSQLGNTPIEVERFRPNVTLAGDHRPFEEEIRPIIGFGDAELIFREPCVRCELPNISRVDASRERQPLKLLGKMSKTRPASKPASFGTYSSARGRWLKVGMESEPEQN